jgi:hypothetical protein
MKGPTMSILAQMTDKEAEDHHSGKYSAAKQAFDNLMMVYEESRKPLPEGHGTSVRELDEELALARFIQAIKRVND